MADDETNSYAGVGMRLRQERIRLGFSRQADFAFQLGISRKAQSNFECDTQKPGLHYLMKLDNAGADILYIITGRRAASLKQVKGDSDD